MYRLSGTNGVLRRFLPSAVLLILLVLGLAATATAVQGDGQPEETTMGYPQCLDSCADDAKPRACKACCDELFPQGRAALERCGEAHTQCVRSSQSKDRLLACASELSKCVERINVGKRPCSCGSGTVRPPIVLPGSGG
ncbi:MAG: hypothetical protein H0S85_15930 [Desulfovibrionaceae bacterium]|jgi:hypothetical protein|nr:hypothetical protein [Desulfovibrionaceae bacterium]